MSSRLDYLPLLSTTYQAEKWFVLTELWWVSNSSSQLFHQWSWLLTKVYLNAQWQFSTTWVIKTGSFKCTDNELAVSLLTKTQTCCPHPPHNKLPKHSSSHNVSEHLSYRWHPRLTWNLWPWDKISTIWKTFWNVFPWRKMFQFEKKKKKKSTEKCLLMSDTVCIGSVSNITSWQAFKYINKYISKGAMS